MHLISFLNGQNFVGAFNLPKASNGLAANVFSLKFKLQTNILMEIKANVNYLHTLWLKVCWQL